MSARSFAILLVMAVTSSLFMACGSSPTRGENGGGVSSGSGGTSSSNRGKKAEVISIAKSLLGTPYRAGGTEPRGGFDCSGFVMYVFRQVGVNLPRSAADQFASLPSVRRPEAGDLVFFHTFGTGISHVGIYMGNDTFIHSPRSGRDVDYDDMRIDYWKNAYRGARRVF